MADGYTSIKRKPQGISPIYNAPEDDTCFDHCVELNGDELDAVGAPMPGEVGETIHFSAMAKVVGFGATGGHRHVRLEITDVLFVENETEEAEEEAEGEEK